MYNKQQYCVFCGKCVLKISRHLEEVHRNEPDVAIAFTYPKHSKQRKMHLERLRKRGNFAHNAEVVKTGIGHLIPCKRPKQELQEQDYMSCMYCQGLFSKKSLWIHARRCKFNPVSDKSGLMERRVTRLSALCGPAPSGVPEGLWKLIHNMTNETILLEIKSDWCIMELGKFLYDKHGSNVNKHVYIRDQLIDLAKLLLHGRKTTPLKTIKDYISPPNFMHTVTAVKHTAGYNDKTRRSRTPSLVKKLGQCLKKICWLLQDEATIKGEKNVAEEARIFLQLYEARWHQIISATDCNSHISDSKWNSPQLLPFTEDVKTLHSYLGEKQEHCSNDLASESSPENWTNLAKVTLAQVFLFNRSGDGEVSKISVSAFTSRNASEPHDYVNLAVSLLEQKLCQHFIRVDIGGESETNVSILLTPAMQEALALLIQKRDECGVLEENPYMFARPSEMSHYNGSDCVQEFVTACGAKDPHSLMSTKLKKQIATISNVLSLKNTEIDQLTDFLSNESQEQTQSHHLSESTLQLTKISRILMALDCRQLDEVEGMRLDDINIDLNGTAQLSNVADNLCEENAAEVVSEPDMKNCDVEPLQERKRRRVTLPQDHKFGAVSPPHADGAGSTSRNHCPAKITSEKEKRKPHVRKRWDSEEIAAVEKHMMSFIKTQRLPGKEDCDRCLKLEPKALETRNWLSIKFYVKNKLTSLRRKTWSQADHPQQQAL